MSVVMISGHLDLSQELFDRNYKPRILNAAEQGSIFVVADARGTDSMAQSYLAELVVRKELAKESVYVFHMHLRPRHNAFGFQTVGGFSSDEGRDQAMYAVSDSIIAFVLPGMESSGTAKNILRFYRMKL